MSERVTETISCRAEDFQPPGVRSEDAAYLGELLASPGGLIQRSAFHRFSRIRSSGCFLTRSTELPSHLSRRRRRFLSRSPQTAGHVRQVRHHRRRPGSHGETEVAKWDVFQKSKLSSPN